MIAKVFDAPLINPPFTQSCCLGPQAAPRRKPNSEYRSREHRADRSGHRHQLRPRGKWRLTRKSRSWRRGISGKSGKILIEARGSLGIFEVPKPLGSHPRNDASKRTKEVLQFVQQRPSLFQITSVETLSEPAVDRSQQFARLLHLALVAPEACEAHCGAEFPRLCLLLTRYG